MRLANATRDARAVGLGDLARYVTYGASPRASINMVLAGQGAGARARPRVRAARRTSRELALDVLRHRLVLSYEALADDVSADDVIDRILAALPPPEVVLRERMPHGGATVPSDAWTPPAPTPQTPERVLRRLEWQVIRRLDGRLQGNYRTIFRGVGTDFRDLREYEPGDDVRHIDWNVTARMDTPFVRQYSEDRELDGWLLLDRSPSMGFGPIDRPKELVLCELATTVARAAHPRRQPRRRHPLRQRRSSSIAAAAQRPQPGARAHHASCCGPPGSHGTITDLTGLLESPLGA